MNAHVLLDTGAACVAFGVQPATIRQWAKRGKLVVKGRSGRRNLYSADDIERLVDTSPTLRHTRRQRVHPCPDLD